MITVTPASDEGEEDVAGGNAREGLVKSKNEFKAGRLILKMEGEFTIFFASQYLGYAFKTNMPLQQQILQPWWLLYR
ncbi:hypothetical protein LIER_33542 [Lithospermum erythrorhizon]|uniref:Uncharacterized protein n=1 Tax=Lithospermum erythrorhizon TaxID=34254 RepID=A0AAV3RZ90_LITER